MKISSPYILFLLLSVMVSCSPKKNNIVYFDTDYSTEEVTESTPLNSDVISVPFREENGVKYLQVKVNGIGLEMIFDTGCSGTLLSLAEAEYLYQKGKLSQEDILGRSMSRIADGSVVENARVNLHEVVIGDKIQCLNVDATISNNVDAPLLLGNEVLDRVSSYTIDNENHTINFILK